jgi:hypothetical protein
MNPVQKMIPVLVKVDGSSMTITEVLFEQEEENNNDENEK